MPQLSVTSLRVLPAWPHVDDWSAILVEAIQNASRAELLERPHVDGAKLITHILPVSASILTSSGLIKSGLNVRRHSIVALIRFSESW